MRIMAIVLLAAGCAAPTMQRTQYGATLVRYGRGLDLAQVDAVAHVTVDEQLCHPSQFAGLTIEVVAADKLPVSCEPFSGQPCFVVGQCNAENRKVRIASAGPHPCMTLVHELGHWCRGMGHYDPKDQRLREWVKQIAVRVFRETCE